MKDDTRQPPEATSLKKRLAIFELIFDSIYNGVMVTDADGYITHFNKPYGRFLGLDPEAQIGKHCTEVVENTRMHIVAKTGKAEINQAHWIKGQNMVVQRIPIKMDGKVIAVFGQVMFKDVKDVGKLAHKLSLLESKIKLYEEELLNLRSTRYTINSIVGRSRAIDALKAEALRAATNHFSSAHIRGKRHRKRAFRTGDPSRRPAQTLSVCADQLRCHPQRSHRIGTVRIREGRLYRSPSRRQTGKIRTRPQRYRFSG